MRRKLYANGDVRTIRKFLFLPLVINHELRWLEFAKIKQEFVEYGSCFAEFNRNYWYNLKFAD